MGYYECPMLCSLVLNGLVESLQGLKADTRESFRNHQCQHFRK